jgi:hypothetical protein
MVNGDEMEWAEVNQSGYAEGIAEREPGDEQSEGGKTGGPGDHKSDLPGDGNQPAVSNPKFPPPTKTTR